MPIGVDLDPRQAYETSKSAESVNYEAFVVARYYQASINEAKASKRQARLHTVGFGLAEGQPAFGVGQRPSLRVLYPSCKRSDRLWSRIQNL